MNRRPSFLRILQHNVNGFYSKQNNLEMNLRVRQPHICVLQEGFRSAKSVSTFSFNDTYKNHWSETGRAGFLFRGDVRAKGLFFFHCEDKYTKFGYETAWLRVHCTNSAPLLFCSFYRNCAFNAVRTSGAEDARKDTFCLFKLQEELIAAKKVSPNVLFCGDFNAHSPMWFDKKLDTVGQAVMDFIFENDLVLLNTKSGGPTFETREASSHIDLSLCSVNLRDKCSAWKLSDLEHTLDSDHHPITFQVQLGSYNQSLPRVVYERWNFANVDWNAFERCVRKELRAWKERTKQRDMETCSALDIATEEWTECVTRAARKCIGKKKVHRGTKPWWSHAMYRLRKQVQRLKRKLRKRKTAHNYFLYRKAQREFRRRLRGEKHEYMKRFVEEITDEDTRLLFSKYRSVSQNKLCVIPTLIRGDETAHNDSEKAEMLATHYAQPPVAADACDEKKEFVEGFLAEHALPNKFEECEGNREENSAIRREEVVEAIRHTASFKAHGPDEIHNLFLKNGGNTLIDSLVFLFNWSLRLGYMPSCWKRWNIVPIPKPDRDHSVCKNHRPIALLSCAGKLLERIVARRVAWFVREHKLISPRQAGFQQWHNTYELLLRLTETIAHSFKCNSVTYAVFLDISSAYDSVWRDGLRYKLREQYGMKGRLFWWIDSFLADRRGRVVLNGSASQWRDFDVGVPQGSSLSPILFILYINDIVRRVHVPIQVGLFADDVALWTKLRTKRQNEMERQCDVLQRSLDDISAWSREWRMILAPSKTQYIVFRRKNKRLFPQPTLRLNGAPLEETETVKYLGLVIDRQLTYKQHVEYLYGKCARKLRFLSFLCSYKGIRPQLNAYLHLYKSIIRTALEYASPFWNSAAKCHKQRLDRIQHSALRRILGCMRQASGEVVEMILQMPPLELRRQQETVRLKQRCMRMKQCFPEHNLSCALDEWNDDFTDFRNEDLRSPLARAALHSTNACVRYTVRAKHLSHRAPWGVLEVPSGTHSPFPPLSAQSSDDVLASLCGRETVIWTDGSVHPNPGPGGLGMYVQRAELTVRESKAVPRITTNIECEILALRRALKHLQKNPTRERVIIFCDCLPVIHAIYNKWKCTDYQALIEECQHMLRTLENVPEIYWVKGHVGIHGNEVADKLAKTAQQDAALQCPTPRKLKNAEYGLHHGLNKFFTRLWNREWTLECRDEEHKTAKFYLPDLHSALEYERIVLHNLNTSERRFVCRIISGKVGLNEFLCSINCVDSPDCEWCKTEESVEHFLLHCRRYRRARKKLFASIDSLQCECPETTRDIVIFFFFQHKEAILYNKHRSFG